MSDPRPLSKTDTPADPGDRFAEKARTLIGLLGRDGVRTLAERNLPTEMAARLMQAVGRSDSLDPPSTVLPEALQRRLDKPLLPSAARDETRQDRDGPDGSGDVRSDPVHVQRLIALNARPGDLTDEHPAVLAMLLSGQSPAITAATLRSLRGETARRVLRCMDELARDT